MATGSLLHSSPARPIHHDPFVMISSSPEFPLLVEISAKKPKNGPLRNGSRAAPIPENVNSSFTTAASLWRRDQVEYRLETADEEGRAPKKQTFASKVRSGEPKATTAHTSDDLSIPDRSKERDVGSPAPRRRKATKEPPADVDASTKDEPWRKFKVSSASTEGQTTLPTCKVTKALTMDKAGKRTETTYKHSPRASRPTVPKTALEPIDLDEPMNLELAMTRRKDWTPPHTTAHRLNPNSSPSTTQESSSPSRERTKTTAEEPKQGPKKLFESFRCNANESQRALVDKVAPADVDVLGKRKLIQMVSTNVSKPPEESPVKSKAPKKKPRTITELATAAYRVPPENDEGPPSKPVSLLTSFDTGGGRVALEKSGVQGSKKSAKPRASKKKGGKGRDQILLSPAAAIKQVSRQEFIFGTSSQLACEQSPTLLRDLESAMKPSNEIEDDLFDSSSSSLAFVSRSKSGNKLWKAAARDIGGDLVNVAVIDLVGSPEFPANYLDAHTICTTSEESPTRATADLPTEIVVGTEQSAVSISSSRASRNLRPPSFATQRKAVESEAATVLSCVFSQQTHLAVRADDSSSEDSLLPASNQEQNEAIEATQSGASQGQIVEVPRPKYELFTDAQLSREITSYGFKPVKKRAAMIALLDQCWGSRNRMAAGIQASQFSSMPTVMVTRPAEALPAPAPKPRGRLRKNPVPVSPDATSTLPDAGPSEPGKRPRGRPRKDGTLSAKTTASSTSRTTMSDMPFSPPEKPIPEPRKAATKSTTEIVDPDSEDFLSEPDPTFSSPAPADLSISDETELSLTASPTSQQARLFSYITRAVTTAPRSSDPTNPSWHEKMLMYDPIVLEHLAAWLNSGQLDRVGYDGEVSPFDVKKWCESKSVCCLWRVNLHGKERKRF